MEASVEVEVEVEGRVEGETGRDAFVIQTLK